MSGELNGDGCIVYATEVSGINDDGTNYNIYPDKVTAFPNMSSIPVNDGNPHKKDKRVPLYPNLTDEQTVDIIIEASLKLLGEKYKIKPDNFIDSSDETLPYNMHHFEQEIVDIVNELNDELDVYDINNLPLCVSMVAEILNRYSEDIVIRDELKTNEALFYGFKLLYK
ncbi:MAG: hypothetical protein KAS11_04305 [Candidatus Aenigmarchaeota archaeon]|nr:hypothetical protein [Candidatus Aenigmarchaeota archaeon]